jgi:hypothetical protein
MTQTRCTSLFLFAVLSAFFRAPAGAADWTQQDLAAAAALRDRALSGTNAYDRVSSLVNDVGPRFAGSPGDAAAVRWAMNTLGALGFTRVRSQDVLVPRWIRGTAEVTIVGNPPRPLVATSLGGSIGTSEEGLEAPVIEVASLEALSALPATNVSGKIVFINQRMERTRDVSGYANAVKIRSQGPAAAGQLGAAAVLIRSVGTSEERIAHTGATTYRVDAPRIPAFALAHADADLLSKMIKGSKSLRVRLKSTARELPATWSANVIGEIPGRDRPGEIVLLAAHLDSWDITPGALDDAAGVGIVIEAARLIGRMDRKPSRTVRVVLFANEEFGLSGGREYVRVAADEVAKHVLAMEADLGAGPIYKIRSLVAPEALASIETMREVLQPLSLEAGTNDAHGGSDIEPLRAQGVPILELSHDATHYFDVHHTLNDTLAKVDAKALDQAVAAYAVAAWLAATKQGDFGRLQVEPPPTAQR